ncbi:MAG: hypothetical protein V3V86_07910, partial [Gammaproteobacteria bacterium]
MALKQVSNMNPRSRRVASGSTADRDLGSDSSLRASGVAVIETEARALTALAARVDRSFADACRLLLQCEGR